MSEIRQARRLLLRGATVDQVRHTLGCTRDAAIELIWALKRFPADHEALDHLEAVRWAQANRVPLINGRPAAEVAKGNGLATYRWIPTLDPRPRHP